MYNDNKNYIFSDCVLSVKTSSLLSYVAISRD